MESARRAIRRTDIARCVTSIDEAIGIERERAGSIPTDRRSSRNPAPVYAPSLTPQGQVIRYHGQPVARFVGPL
jgi:hypothetical protein